MKDKVQITELTNRGDARGFSFTTPAEALAFVGRMGDVHLASTQPGAVRGNHYHLQRRQAIMALPGVKWSLHWDDGEGSPAQHREFVGGGSVLVLLPPGVSIAVRNDGDCDLWIVTISSEAYEAADSIPRKVV